MLISTREVVALEMLKRGASPERACELADEFVVECCKRWGHAGPVLRSPELGKWECGRCGADLPSPPMYAESACPDLVGALPKLRAVPTDSKTCGFCGVLAGQSHKPFCGGGVAPKKGA